MDECSTGGMEGGKPHFHCLGGWRAEVMGGSQPGTVIWIGGKGEPNRSHPPKMGPLLRGPPPPPKGHNPISGLWCLLKGQPGSGKQGQGGVSQ